MDQQVLVRRELRGARILGQEIALLEVEFAQLGDARRLREHVGAVEQRRHLLLGLDVALLPEEPKPFGIVKVLAGADREQHVVSFGVFLLEVVRIVGRDHRKADVGGDAQHPLRHELLLGDAVILDLEPEPVRSERAGEPRGARLRGFVIPLAQIQRDLSREARGQTDDSLVVLRQHFLVDARPAVIALEESD